MHILVTGGAGYIGTHTCIALIEAGYSLTVVDNLSNSHRESLRRVEQITGTTIPFYYLDIRDKESLRVLFGSNAFTSVIHFAGLKSVVESLAEPLMYHENNVVGTETLLDVMTEFGVHELVFSSSANVYGESKQLPINESAVRSASNPYGRSKLAIEQMLEGLAAAGTAPWKIVNLRYFNPVGAHASGRIGEDPNGVPNNLMPLISQVAVGRIEKLQIFGDDYPTSDGTGVRDYIHVVDLAEGHVAALQYLNRLDRSEFLAVNLGTGNGISVMEMVESFQRVSGRCVPFEVVARRLGDVAASYADVTLAAESLNWKASRGVDEMCADTWRWQSLNPDGYSS